MVAGLYIQKEARVNGWSVPQRLARPPFPPYPLHLRIFILFYHHLRLISLRERNKGEER